MCTTLWSEGGKEIDSIGALRALCGTLILNPNYGGITEDELGENECLCSIDVKATMAEAGFDVKEDPTMLGDWIYSERQAERESNNDLPR